MCKEINQKENRIKVVNVSFVNTDEFYAKDMLWYQMAKAKKEKLKIDLKYKIQNYKDIENKLISLEKKESKRKKYLEEELFLQRKEIEEINRLLASPLISIYYSL